MGFGAWLAEIFIAIDEIIKQVFRSRRGHVAAPGSFGVERNTGFGASEPFHQGAGMSYDQKSQSSPGLTVGGV
ncbi:MAG: hypothetical protein P4M00_16315 [Azospirillaceae bacterium]|nr:hypothetical protein [Azospirillaceae bacterium]